MTEQEVKQKIDDALSAVKEYSSGKIRKGYQEGDIKKALEELNEKRHILGSAGQTCPSCGGSGRI